MTDNRVRALEPPQAVVAGHICLDIIPEVGEGASRFQPGQLIEAGPAMVSTGGAVSNTGLALHHLGVPVRLIGKVGDDIFGDAVLKIVSSYGEGLEDAMTIAPGESTSYTVILNPPASDRMFIHCTGCNATFTSADVGDEALRGVKLMHFGYPPLMPAMFANDGEEGVRLFQRAKKAGLTTSLDMAMPDAAGLAGKVAWARLLRATLPYVDVFLPSIEELLIMLKDEMPEDRVLGDSISDVVAHVTPAVLTHLSAWVLDKGAAIAAIKVGDRGLYVRTADRGRMANIGAVTVDSVDDWAEREIWAPCFSANVAGTTGSGDATIAGFLMGLLREMTFADTVRAACAVGGCSVEAPDAVTGIQSWDETSTRIAAGWPRRPIQINSEGWRWNSAHAFWER